MFSVEPEYRTSPEIHYDLDGPGIGSSVGEIFWTRPDRPRGQPTLLHSGKQE
jgi:hypothetical protein